ncbi:MAG TPA: hypothetical protein VLA58_09530 [Chitinophagaceae bacterium]|nr:hypothetical protein [Chitinophagaceae bacterium]
MAISLNPGWLPLVLPSGYSDFFHRIQRPSDHQDRGLKIAVLEVGGFGGRSFESRGFGGRRGLAEIH